MATRTLLCVEPDESALQTLTSALTPYGFDITNISNGDQAVEWAKQNRPALMIVSVEPKKVGYAICNKLKRSVDLREIPLILTSAEEAPAKFEQHKTFKLRADEYMFKPFDQEDIVRKVEGLVGLAQADAAPADMYMTEDLVSSEIAIEADDIVDDSAAVPTPPPAPAEGDSAGGDGTQQAQSELTGPHGDSMFDQDAAAAFEALGLKDQPTLNRATPANIDAMFADTDDPAARAGEALQPPPADGDGWDEGGATRISTDAMDGSGSPVSMAPETETAPVPDQNAGPSPTSVPEYSAGDSMANMASSEPNAEPSPPAELEIAPGVLREAPADSLFAPPDPDAVNATSVVSTSMFDQTDSQMAELQGRIHDLENDKRRLQTELDDLRGNMQLQPFHKEKDLLGLRETINRKEKDVLDLRDALDAKERQILDHKDRIREHERARRDLEEKMLGMEKSLMHLNERVAALVQDKERAVERERATKVRLDDSHQEITKAHDEIESLRKRLGSAEDRARAEMDKARTDFETHVADMEQVHRAEIVQMKAERDAAEAAREEEIKAEKARAEAAHAAETENLQRRHAEELAAAEERKEVELSRVRREQEKAVAALKEENTNSLIAERQAHEAALEAKDREYKTELQSLRRRHEDEMAGAELRRQKEAEEAEARRVADVDAAETRRRTELQARDEQHHTAVAEMDRRHLDEKTEMTERHRAELEQAQSRATRVEGELALRTQELTEANRRLQRLEGEVDTTRTDLRDREVKLTQARDRVSELEAKVTDFEDQILRAYQKLRNDDKSIDRAKRALAVALTVLDDRGAAPIAAAPATPSAPNGPAAASNSGPINTAAPQRPPEDGST